MNGHTTRVCRREAGFSFVELLITIVIAGIAFAAMVPLFVQAQQVSSGDKMRAIALNVAQDRMEKLRQLDFELVIPGYLEGDGSYIGEFRDTWTEHTEGGGTRVFGVDYAVSEETVSATDDRIAYKVVTVTVSWTGPPQPAKDVVLTTMFYRQYSGPTLVDFIVDPRGLVVIPNQPPSPDPEKMVQNPVALYATVNDADIASMRPRTVGATERAGRVDFSVTSSSGTVFPTDSVPCTVDSTVVFQSAWSPPTGGGGDGYHTFKAVAYSAMGSPGPSWQLVYRVETGPPAAVTNLIGTAALEWAMITWNASVTGDVDHYEVWRDGQLLPLAAHIDPAAGSMGYTDDTLDGSNGTSYEYKVRAVDWMGNYTAASTIPNILVSDDPANVVPLPASNFEGQAINDKARLAWVGPAGVLGYQVYQTIDGETNTFTTASATLDVEQGWGTTALYQVKPFVAGGVLATDYATLLLGPGVIVDSVAWLEVTIDPERLYTLTITNTTKCNGRGYLDTELPYAATSMPC